LNKNKGEETMQNFRTYQLAKEQYLNVKKIKAEKYFQDQLHRASLSVALNLAEGSAKRSTKDRRRFYEMALASHRETQVLLDMLENTGLITAASSLGGCLYKLVRSLDP
jgi:four helix bundle protein